LFSWSQAPKTADFRGLGALEKLNTVTSCRILCAYNGVPFDPTGERINRDGLWCVYEFARQVDAIMFWDKFRGRWMRHGDFFYPDPPEDIPIMKDPPNLDKFIPKYRS
jgi:hypothetical protein